jgi:hypothetical protein
MATKNVFFGVFIVAFLVLIGGYLFTVSIGAKLERTLRASKPRPRRSGKAPIGVVRMVDGDSSATGSHNVLELWAYDEIYMTIGVTTERFQSWTKEFGCDSLGSDAHGSLLAPGFPIFSKVAWMFVDPIDLSESEAGDLLRECDKAMLKSTNQAAIEELIRIRNLALEATKRHSRLRFGHP